MKKFMDPELLVVKFDTEAITSGDISGGTGTDNDAPGSIID